MSDVHLNVLVPPKGVRCMCKKCRKPFLEGVAAIEVFFDGVPHFLKADPLPVCSGCGESKHTCMVFGSRDEAMSKAQSLMPRINAEGPGFLSLVASASLGLGRHDQN